MNNNICHFLFKNVLLSVQRQGFDEWMNDMMRKKKQERKEKKRKRKKKHTTHTQQLVSILLYKY